MIIISKTGKHGNEVKNMKKVVDIRSIGRPVNLSNRQEKLDLRKREIVDKQEQLKKHAKRLLRGQN